MQYICKPRTVEAIQPTPNTFRQILNWLPDDTEGVRTMKHCVLCASGEHQPSIHKG